MRNKNISIGRGVYSQPLLHIQLLHSSYFTLLIFTEKRDQKGLRPLVIHNRKRKLLSESSYNPKDKMSLKY